MLPNLVCTIILACGVVIGILFLEETHEDRKYRRDIGLEIGQWLLNRAKPSSHQILMSDKAAVANCEESESLLVEAEEEPP